MNPEYLYRKTLNRLDMLADLGLPYLPLIIFKVPFKIVADDVVKWLHFIVQLVG